MKRRGQLRLIERSIRQGWDTPEDEQRRAWDFVQSVLDDPAATAREREAGLRVIHALVQQDGSTDAEIRRRALAAVRYHQNQELERRGK